MRRWFFPMYSGDFSLEPDGDARCVLVVTDPTPAEMARLGAFLREARQKGWVDQAAGVASTGESRLVLGADLQAAGKVLVPNLMPKTGTLTAVRCADGVVRASLRADEVPNEVSEAVDAVTVKRPTHCCPRNQPGSREVRADAVLRTFLSSRQLREWEADQSFLVFGHLSGHAYRVHHRHHPTAVRRGKLCLDLDDDQVLHLWDWSVPPAEEALAVKLFLEHHEPVVRNHSSCLFATDKFENPYGNGLLDGTDSARFLTCVGESLRGLGLLGAMRAWRRREVGHG